MIKTNRFNFYPSLKTVLFFACITSLAYLPIISMLFALKNDAFTGYFPPKFFMSESIYSGVLPLWNPYINYGLPQYGDMSSAFWSPVTWLIASTVGYNVYSFTLEEAFYIFLAGLGMYRLTSYWNIKYNIKLIAGVSYMCSGYFVGHLQHFNWISGAAFFPWCLFFYLEALRSNNIYHLIKFGFAFGLFFSSAHPGLIIGASYFLMLILISTVIHQFKKRHDRLKLLLETGKKLFYILIAAFLFIIGPLIGYLEILPYISRGDKLLVDLIGEPATIPSWISVLSPFIVNKNNDLFNTDISIRNSYFGLFFLILFLTGVVNKKTKWQQLLLMSGIFFFLLSFGGIFKNIFYEYLPLFSYVRLSGEFRLFSIISFILFSAIQLNKTDAAQVWIKLRPVIRGLLIILILSLPFSLYAVILKKQSIFFNQSLVMTEWRLWLKQIVDHITFYDTLLIAGLMQILLLLFISHCLKKERKSILIFIISGELIITTLLNLPFTGVGKASAKEVQHILDRSPHGIPVPILQPIINNDTLELNMEKMIGNWSFYNKQIGTPRPVPYPINLHSTLLFFEDPNLTEINRKPYLYFSISDLSEKPDIKVSHFTPNHISIKANAPSEDTLVFKQNYYPNWLCTINNIPINIQKSEATFLSVPVKKGLQEITFQFRNNKIVALIFLNLSLFSGAFIILVVHIFPKRNK